MTDQRINMRLRQALHECHVSSREIFREMVPLLEAGEPYGFYQIDADWFAEQINASTAAVYQSLEDLRKHRVIRRSRDRIYCPLLIADLVVRVTA